MFEKRKPDMDLIYKVADGVGLPMRVYLPKDLGDKKVSAVLCIHGGGWRGAIKDNSAWDGSWMSNHAQYYADKGKIGISISYRDLDVSDTVYTINQIEDCVDAVKYIYDNLKNVDTDNLSAIGDSAGAHLALCVGFKLPENMKFKKIVACNPVTNLNIETWASTGKTEEDRINISPVFMIDKLNDNTADKTEILCMHGEKDTVVSIKDTVVFYEKLKEKGFKTEMISLKNAQHAFILWGYTAKEDDVFSCMEKIDMFLDK